MPRMLPRFRLICVNEHCSRFDATTPRRLPSNRIDAIGANTFTGRQLPTMNPSTGYDSSFVPRQPPTGITLRRRQTGPVAMGQRVRVLHQEQRRIGCDLSQVARRSAARAAGVPEQNPECLRSLLTLTQSGREWSYSRCRRPRQSRKVSGHGVAPSAHRNSAENGGLIANPSAGTGAAPKRRPRASVRPIRVD